MKRQKSMRDRIRTCKSLTELGKLISEAEEFRYARPDSERRIQRAAEQRRKELE